MSDEADALARLAPRVAPAGTRVGATHQDALLGGQALTHLVRVTWVRVTRVRVTRVRVTRVRVTRVRVRTRVRVGVGVRVRVWVQARVGYRLKRHAHVVRRAAPDHVGLRRLHGEAELLVSVRVRVRVRVAVGVGVRVRVRVRLHGEAELLQAARELGGVVVVLDLLRARARG